MARIPDWATDLFDEDEKEAIENGNGFKEVTAVEVTKSGREEHKALCEFLDNRNPFVVNPMDGVRLFPYDSEREELGYESEEAFNKSGKDIGWFVKK